MEDIKLIYSNNNEEIILINHFNLKVFRDNCRIGKFNINDNILNIEWDHNVNEYYIKITDNNDISTYKFINGNYRKICINNEIIDLNNINYTIINDNLILLKTNNYYTKVYEYYNNIFNDVTNVYNKLIYIKNNSWEELCVINNYTYFIFRQSDINEYGTYEINNNILIINWEKWDKELFYLINNIYIHENIINNKNNSLETNEINLNEINFSNNEIINLSEQNIFSFEYSTPENNSLLDNLCVDKLNIESTIFSEELLSNENTEMNLFSEELYSKENIEMNLFSGTQYLKENTEMNLNDYVNLSEQNIDKELSSNEKELYFYHKDWNEYCILNYDKNILYKKNDISETAQFIINNNIEKNSNFNEDSSLFLKNLFSNENIIILNWKKWESEIFYLFDNEYYSNNYIQYVLILNNVNDKPLLVKYILNNYNNKVYSKNYCYVSEYILNEDYLIIDDKYYYKKISSLYIDKNIFYKELYINENINSSIFSEITIIVYFIH
jgi:hypothetical protein